MRLQEMAQWGSFFLQPHSPHLELRLSYGGVSESFARSSIWVQRKAGEGACKGEQEKRPWSCSLPPLLGLFKSTHPVPPFLQVRGGYTYCAALENEPHLLLVCQEWCDPGSGPLLRTCETPA